MKTKIVLPIVSFLFGWFILHPMVKPMLYSKGATNSFTIAPDPTNSESKVVEKMYYIDRFEMKNGKVTASTGLREVSNGWSAATWDGKTPIPFVKPHSSDAPPQSSKGE